MKVLKRIFLVFVLLCSGILADAQEFSNAAAYMQYFSDQYKQVSSDLWEYMSAIARGRNARKVEYRRKELMSTLLDAEAKIGAMDPYRRDAGLRDSMVAYLQASFSILHDDYDKIVEMEEKAEQSYESMEAYINVRRQANEKMSMASDGLDAEQKRFAFAHNINLIEDRSKLSRNLSRAGRAFDYYDEVFLIYFKSQCQEVNMILAMNREDLKAMEQCRNALKYYAKEGLDSLARLKSFDGDLALTMVCRELLKFYLMEVEEKMPIIIDFFRKKQDFDRIKAKMDEKGKSATDEELEVYTGILMEYNALVNNFNAINLELNREREEMLLDWDDAVKTFLDKQAG